LNSLDYNPSIVDVSAAVVAIFRTVIFVHH